MPKCVNYQPINTAHLNIRINPAIKEQINNAAKAKDMKPSPWIRQALINQLLLNGIDISPELANSWNEK